MSNDRPAPLVPAEVDLRDYQFMPFYGARLFDSETWLSCDAEEKVAALASWWKSWWQVPAGSLPDDDRLLAHLLGYGVAIKAFQGVKKAAMRGWRLCSDGRLYHPVVAEIVLDSWHGKLVQTWAKECDRLRKENKRRGELSQPPLPIPPKPDRSSLGIPKEHLQLSAGNTRPVPPEPREASGGIPGDFPPNRRKGKEIEVKKEEPSASVCTDPPSPAVAVIQVFDEARATAFGEAQRRGWPTGTDRTVAERWLAAGATIELCRDVCGAQCARMAAKGKRPPDSLALFERDIADAIAAAQRPMAAGKATNGHAPSDDGEEKRRTNRDRLRLESWQSGADWSPNWGPEPPAEQRRKSA